MVDCASGEASGLLMADDEGEIEDSHQQVETPASLLRYDRDELLRLQDGALGGHLQQDEWWIQHLEDLGPEVADELQELQAVPESSHLRRRSKNSERRLRSKARREAQRSVSVNALGSDKDEHQDDSSFFEDSSVNENLGRRRYGGRGSRSYESFDDEDLPEVESFQPQAFAVEGEPDFESGEPEDGWEYLRRVKYEAARCPKVVVAKIDVAKLVSEQTSYMPELPEIPDCPVDLRPSKEWEKQVLGDFSLLRMALSNIHAPPTAERIPSLRNKAAWEMRCFGSTTAVQDEESKEVDTVTTKELPAEPGNEESAIEAKTPLLQSGDSAQNDNEFAAVESRAEHWNDEKELLEPFIELVESQIEPLLKAAPTESSYVIDLGLITGYVPSHEPEYLFNESLYLISGEPAGADDDSEVRKAACSSSGTSEPEDGGGQRAKLFDSQRVNLTEPGHVEGSSFEIINHFEHLSIGEPVAQHDDYEGMGPLSSHPSPSYIESDRLMTADFVAPAGAYDQTVAVASADLDFFNGIEAQGSRPSTNGFEVTDDAIQSTQPSSTFEVIEREDDNSETADFMTSLGGEAWAIDEGEFGEFYSGIDSHFDSLAIGDPEVFRGEMDATLPSFSDTCVPETDDFNLPTADFTDSLIGLEIFRSGNVLVDQPEESVDAHGTEFSIDEPLVELFNKVFQLVGVSQLPFIHLLLRLDEVSRAALLRHHVTWLENVDGLPTDRALWLLALAAVVDVPLDSQTSAAFRAMLRHCSGVRALKQTRDDEDIYLLNVLIIVAGVYFGQAEASLP